jgi:hypothetical protein
MGGSLAAPIPFPRIVRKEARQRKNKPERDIKELGFSWWLHTVGAGAEKRSAGLITGSRTPGFVFTKLPNRGIDTSPISSNLKPKDRY